MARLIRRGIGRRNIEKALNRGEFVTQSLEGIESAYAGLCDEAEKYMGDSRQSRFWAIVQSNLGLLLRPVVQESAAAMDRSMLSAMMRWNAGMCRAEELRRCAAALFGKWFYEECLPEFDSMYKKLDGELKERLDECIAAAMEANGVRPVHLHIFSTEDFAVSLREKLIKERPAAVENRIYSSMPTVIRDTRIPFLRRRRLRKGVDSFFAARRAEGDEHCGFICDAVMDEKLALEHANAVLSALAKSLTAEKLRILME